MRKVLMVMALVAAFVVPSVKAEAQTVTVAECAAGTSTGTSLAYFTGAVGAAAAASYLILAQKDQYDEPIWHRLACGVFGDEGRVGNETDSACKHIE